MTPRHDCAAKYNDPCDSLLAHPSEQKMRHSFIDDSSPFELAASRGFATRPERKSISALRPNKKPRNERGLIESDARVQRKSKAKGFLPSCALGPL
jgi:hypothetical protein